MTEGISSSTKELIALDSSEVVARALFTPQWDERVQRGSPGCFKRNNTSVTRHRNLTFSQVLSYLKSDVEKPGTLVVVRAVGIISVSQIKSIGFNNPDPVHFEVFEKETLKNPAHAEIYPFQHAATAQPNKEVPKGLSRQMSNALDITIVSPAGDIEGNSPPLYSVR